MFRVQQLLVSWIVSSVADIADVKPTDIQGALLLGHANISNLRLRLHRINDAIPVSAGVECTGAQLDSLVVVAEWFSLSAKPIRIEATGVRLTFAARDPNKALGNIVGESDREARKLVLLQLQNCDTGVQADGENKAGDLKEDSDGDHQSSTDEDFASCVSDSFSSREIDGAAAVSPAAEAVKPSSMWSWFTSTVSSIVPPPVTSRKVHITVRDVSCDLLCGDAALRFLIDSVEISFDLSDPSKPRDCQVHGVRVELLRRSSGVTLPVVPNFDADVTLVSLLPGRHGRQHAGGHSNVAIVLANEVRIDVSERVLAVFGVLAEALQREWNTPSTRAELIRARRWRALLRNKRQSFRERWSFTPEHLRQARFAREAHQRLMHRLLHGTTADETLVMDLLDVEEAIRFRDVVDYLRARAVDACRHESLTAKPTAAATPGAEDTLSASIAMKKLRVIAPFRTCFSISDVDVTTHSKVTAVTGVASPNPRGGSANKKGDGRVVQHRLSIGAVEWVAAPDLVGPTVANCFTLLRCVAVPTLRADIDDSVAIDITVSALPEKRQRATKSREDKALVARIKAAPIVVAIDSAYLIELVKTAITASGAMQSTIAALVPSPPAAAATSKLHLKPVAAPAPRIIGELDLVQVSVTFDDWIVLSVDNIRAQRLNTKHPWVRVEHTAIHHGFFVLGADVGPMMKAAAAKDPKLFQRHVLVNAPQIIINQFSQPARLTVQVGAEDEHNELSIEVANSTLEGIDEVKRRVQCLIDVINSATSEQAAASTSSSSQVRQRPRPRPARNSRHSSHWRWMPRRRCSSASLSARRSRCGAPTFPLS
jgi:hypothetical protein